jgi:hypothetical protein
VYVPPLRTTCSASTSPFKLDEVKDAFTLKGAQFLLGSCSGF